MQRPDAIDNLAEVALQTAIQRACAATRDLESAWATLEAACETSLCPPIEPKNVGLNALIEPYRTVHFEGVRALWKEAFPNDPPWNRAEVVIPAKIASQPELFLVALDDEQVVGAALAGYDGHRGWLYSVAVRESHCRRGIGSMLVWATEAQLRTMGCAKVNLQVLGLNIALLNFYHSLGYGTEDRISMGKRISVPSL